MDWPSERGAHTGAPYEIAGALRDSGVHRSYRHAGTRWLLSANCQRIYAIHRAMLMPRPWYTAC